MYGITFYSYNFKTIADNLIEINCYNRYCYNEEQYFNGYVESEGAHSNIHCTRIRAYLIGTTKDDFDTRARTICAAHTIKLRILNKCTRPL